MNTLLSLRTMTAPLAFTAKAADTVLTLELYDVIGADMFTEGITGKAVSEAISGVGDFSSITLRLNSPGGDLFEGVTIYNLLKSQGKPVNVVVDGLAASSASLIAMAGDTCVMSDGSCMMVHNASGIALGGAADMRKMADVLDTVTGSAADIYVARTGVDKNKVLSLMAAETWMTAAEAVAAHFATAVSESKAISNSFNLSVFEHTPAALKAKQKEVEPEPIVNPEQDGAYLIDILRKKLELSKRK
jgi:ATP-dependent Clp protease, protease subunit